jgi:hypothetical protein
MEGRIQSAIFFVFVCLLGVDIALRLSGGSCSELDIIVDQKHVRSIAVGTGASADPGGIAIGNGVHANRGEILIRVPAFEFTELATVGDE